MKNQLKWEITLWQSTRILFSTEIPHGCITDKMVADLLRTLVAKAGLSNDEICDCFTKQRVRRHANHLDISTEGTKTRFIMSCGSNPYATAVVNHGRYSDSGI